MAKKLSQRRRRVLALKAMRRRLHNPQP